MYKLLYHIYLYVYIYLSICLYILIAKKNDARKLEKDCLFKQLNNTFLNVTCMKTKDVIVNNYIQYHQNHNITINSNNTSPIRLIQQQQLSKHNTPLSNYKEQNLNNFSIDRDQFLYNLSLQHEKDLENENLLILQDQIIPGWYKISSDMDGFDRNACEMLTLKSESLLIGIYIFYIIRIYIYITIHILFIFWYLLPF